MAQMVSRIIFAIVTFILLISCNSAPVENIYRKENRFRGGLNIPVAFLVSEWGGQPRVTASGSLIEGSEGVLFSAKHFSDVFMGDIVELGNRECKVFLRGKVYGCAVVQVPPLQDAVLLKIKDFKPGDLPRPYKISTEKVKVGDKVFVQGFHPHPATITEFNKKEGREDMVLPIFKDFYEMRTADPHQKQEVVFDSLPAIVVEVNVHVKINTEEHDPLNDLKFKVNNYIKVATIRNHRLSFAGLSGGVLVKLVDGKSIEVVGIITAERPVRLENRKTLGNKAEPELTTDTILVTPIEAVKELYEYARQLNPAL